MNSELPSIRLIYIAGVGRSGSTVLDSLLGNHPLIHSVGELARLPRDGWLENYYCACGEPAGNCPFWTAVYQEWYRLNGGCAVSEYVELQDRFEQFRRWPNLLRAGWTDCESFHRYAEQTFLLLKAIQNISGCMTIVDSSKGVERAFALSQVPQIDLRVVQLVRDARGVVWSHKKAFAKDPQLGLPRDIRPQPAWRAALYWCRMNLQAEWLRRHVGQEKALLIRYEDFMLHTAAVMESLGSMAGFQFADIERYLNGRQPFQVGHAIAGNRVRMKGELKLTFDQEWVQKLSARDRRTTIALAGWFMTRYGYKI